MVPRTTEVPVWNGSVRRPAMIYSNHGKHTHQVMCIKSANVNVCRCQFVLTAFIFSHSTVLNNLIFVDVQLSKWMYTLHSHVYGIFSEAGTHVASVHSGYLWWAKGQSHRTTGPS